MRYRVFTYILPYLCLIIAAFSIAGRVWSNIRFYDYGAIYGGYNPMGMAIWGLKLVAIFFGSNIGLIIVVCLLRKFNIGYKVSLKVDLLLIFVLLFCNIIIWFFYRPAISPFIVGYREYVVKHVDTDSVLEWLEENKSGAEYLLIEEPNWPAAIEPLAPLFVEVYKAENGKSYLQVTCGGGFAHWGILVGPENSIVDHEKNNVMKDKVYGWREKRMGIMMIRNGVYVWEGP